MKNKQEKWYSVEIETETQAEEAVEFALDELNSLGNEVNHLGKKTTDYLTVIGYFNRKIDDEILQNQLNESLQIYGLDNSAIKKVEWREVENQDWLAEWKKNWKPTVTDQFIIAPMWENISEDTEKIVIRIEPSMAFGTGTHETTRLCLQAIEKYYLPEMSFFDVGTGTGILAIGAAKIQGKKEKGKIVGCDTDEDSIVIAKENAEVNEVPEIELYVGSIDENTRNYDFVCANLTADVIVPILYLLVTKFNQTLVLSGILKEQEELVLSEIKKLGVGNCEVKQDGEWISIIVNRFVA